MQALKLDAGFGWRWVVAGWRLFRTQPFSFAALLFAYWLLLLCSSAVIGWIAQGIGAAVPSVSADFVAAVGSLLIAMLTPALTVGFLQACRVAASGLQVHPVLLFAPFRAGRTTVTRLLVLGCVQMLALVLILLATSGTAAFRGDPVPDPSTLSPSTPAGATPGSAQAASGEAPTPAQQEAIRHEAIERLVQALAYLPVALLMWYAPMLVAWHGLSAGKALFFSLVAVWLLLSIALAIVTSLIGLGSVAALVAAPFVMLLLTCMYCSVYATYATVFVDPPAAPVPSPADA